MTLDQDDERRRRPTIFKTDDATLISQYGENKVTSSLESSGDMSLTWDGTKGSEADSKTSIGLCKGINQMIQEVNLNKAMRGSTPLTSICSLCCSIGHSTTDCLSSANLRRSEKNKED